MSESLSAFLSAASFRPARHAAPSAWSAHVPFAAWLVAAQAPALVVTLGLGRGESHLALCDAALDAGLDTSLYAVDARAGSAAPDGRLAELLATHERLYAGISTVLPLTPGAAAERFAPGSVDLLHLHGAAELQQAETLLAAWWPALSPRAVVLVDEIAARQGNAALPLLWDRLARERRCFAFQHGRGLGVIGAGDALPRPVAALFDAGPELRAAIRVAYARLGGEPATAVAVPARVGAGAAEQLAIANQRAAALAAQLHALQRHIALIEASTAWRATAPLRRGLHGLPALRRLLRRAGRVLWWTVTLRLPARLRARRAMLRLGGGNAPDWPPPLEAAAPAALPAPAAPRRVSVIVCVHNALAEVQACLEAVRAYTRLPAELVLVDDGSDAATAAALRAEAASPEVTLVRHETALGYTCAANAGLRAASGELLVLLNSDTVVSAGWIEAIERVFAARPATGIVGPLSNTASWQSVPLLAEGDDWARNERPPGVSLPELAAMVAERQPLHPALPFLNGFCFAIARATLDRVGPFDEAAFPRGYGEENDFCIRARQAGFELRVADDCYVHHAQSKSYSDVRRRRLAEEAGRALAAKHDVATEIDRPAGFCRASLALHGVREWVGGRLQREALRREMAAGWRGARLAFVLPVAAEGGGANVVFQEAAAMRAAGIAVSFVNLRRHEAGARLAYPEEAGWVFLPDEDAVLAHLAAGDADLAVATAYSSAYWLPLRERGAGRRAAYYVQDYEPLFYDDADPAHETARNSYLLDPGRTLVTKTEWNRDVLLQETGLGATVVGPSVNVDLFQPIDRTGWDARPTGLRLCAMVRPSSARRAPEATFALLAELSRRHGQRIECHVFGADEADLAGYRLRHPGAVRNHGRLRREQVAALLRACDVFVDLSTYQAMGLSLLEAMASGLCVIGPTAGAPSEFITDGLDGLLVDTASRAAAAAAIDSLISGERDLAGLRRAAVTTAHGHVPEAAALRLLRAALG